MINSILKQATARANLMQLIEESIMDYMDDTDKSDLTDVADGIIGKVEEYIAEKK